MQFLTCSGSGSGGAGGGSGYDGCSRSSGCGGCGGGRCTGPRDTQHAGMRTLDVPVGRNAKRIDLATGHLKRECKRNITAPEAVTGSMVAVNK